MKTEFWRCIRRLLRRRSPSREVERIVAGWRADEAVRDHRPRRRRERLDLIEGWVMEDVDRAPNGARSRRQDQESRDGGNKPG